MKALICGAGIAGLALANRLHHHGWEVLVVDNAPGPRPQGYMVDFFGPGFEAAIAMGLESELRQAASSVEELHYVDPQGHSTVSADYSLIAEALGGRIVSIMRPSLEQMLRESLPDAVRLRYGTTVDRVEDDGAVLSDGTEIGADLVVGADGVHSRVRSLTFGPERDHLRYLGMHTAAFVFTDEWMHEQVKDRFVLTETLHRQMGFYGLDDGRVAVFAVHRTTDASLPDDPREALLHEYAGMGTLPERALEHCPTPERIYYDQVAQIVPPRWQNGRVGLVGDAAHAVSLVAGQGASLGMAGAYMLAERLHARGSVAEGLADYEARWRPVTDQVQNSARDSLIEWFLPTTRSRLLMRRWGFRWVRVRPVQRMMVSPLFPKRRTPVTELAA